MAKLVIQGGRPLRGKVDLAGAKNSSFKLMVASLLASGETKLKNLSQIDEVRHVSEMIRALGGKVKTLPGRSLVIDTRGINTYVIPQHLGERSRASTLFLGPLLNRFGQAVVPLPGGDAIGKRPLDRHFEALRSLGARIALMSDRVEAAAERLHPAIYKFSKNSHTGTETILMGAVLVPGKTVIEGAAQEPEVDDMISFLNRMGAKIKRQGSKIEITGVKNLRPVEFEVMPDRNQAVSYAVAALATKGEVVVSNARTEHLQEFLQKLKQAGAGAEAGRSGIRFFWKKPLTATSISTRPHPGFMTDWQPLWSVLMTQAAGESAIIEAVFTQRFQFVDDLIKMGAKIKYFDPKPEKPEKFYNFNLNDDDSGNRHGIKVIGPTPLHGGEFEVFDIRAGATLAIAGLIARGETVLNRAELIDRGYEDFAGNLTKLGAKIKRIN